MQKRGSGPEFPLRPIDGTKRPAVLFALVIETRVASVNTKPKPRRKRHHCLHVHSYADLRCLSLNQVKTLVRAG